MVIRCAICGRRVEVAKGRAKYCPECRADIDLVKSKTGSFKDAAEYLAIIRAEERRLNLGVKSIEDIVEQTKETGLSYGYQVAKNEGRL